jgi:hypothetical protein
VQHVWASFTASILSDCTQLKGEISREMVETIPCCWLCIPRTGGCEIINLVSTEYMSYVTSFLNLGNINGMKKKKRGSTDEVRKSLDNFDAHMIRDLYMYVSICTAPLYHCTVLTKS